MTMKMQNAKNVILNGLLIKINPTLNIWKYRQQILLQLEKKKKQTRKLKGTVPK